MSRKVVIAGNWKMHMMAREARLFVSELAPLVRGVRSHVYLAPSFTSIRAAVEAAENSPICIGAQNVSAYCEGAYTGEVSSAMLKEAGARFVLIGHSERRQLFGEDDDIIHRKVKRAIEGGLEPIVCIGETEKERVEHQVERVLQTQLDAACRDLQPDQAAHILLAYEPVWAIGSGKTATPHVVQMAHRVCRTFIEKKWGMCVANGIPILYGGSVKPGNISHLMREPDVDGALIGGVSLKVDSFAEVIQNVEEIVS